MITPLFAFRRQLGSCGCRRQPLRFRPGTCRFLLSWSSGWRGLLVNCGLAGRAVAIVNQIILARDALIVSMKRACSRKCVIAGMPFQFCRMVATNPGGRIDGMGLMAWVVSNELLKYTKHNRLKPVISFIIEKVPWIKPSRWLYLNALAIKAMLCAFCPLSATRSSRNPEGIPASQRVKHPQR